MSTDELKVVDKVPMQVVVDECDDCPYLPGETARMPLEIPSERLTPEAFEQLLAMGYRRSGCFFYRTHCPKCQACEAIRLKVDDFKPSRSQRRAEKRGDQELTLRLAAPIVDERRVELFNRHRLLRDLDHGGPPITNREYENFLMNSAVEVLEFGFYHQEQLVAVSIADVGAESLSAVYCYFDPDFAYLSPGTYSIMKQVQLARKHSFKQLYLGLYVEANRHLNYKARYRPHQRYQSGQWHDFA